MFKCFLVAMVLVVSTVATLHVNSSDEDSERLEKIFTSFIERRCVTNADEKAFDELEESASNLCFCFLFAPSSVITEINEDELSNFFCTDVVRAALDLCFVPFVDKLAVCLDKEEKYFSSFLTKFYNRTMDILCEDGGKRIQGYMNSTEGFECEILDGRYEEIRRKCFSSSDIEKDLQNPSFVLTKDKLCKYFDHSNECFLGLLKKSCKKRTQDIYELHIVNPIKGWCKENVDN